MPAFLLNPLIRWAAVAVVIGLLFGWAVWERHDRVAAEKGEKAARLESDLHEADATRWEAASNLRDGSITMLKAALDQQSALTEQGRAKEAELRTSLDNARLKNDRLSAQADQLSRDLEDEAAKAPGDVRELGPIVARRAPELFN